MYWCGLLVQWKKIVEDLRLQEWSVVELQIVMGDVEFSVFYFVDLGEQVRRRGLEKFDVLWRIEERRIVVEHYVRVWYCCSVGYGVWYVLIWRSWEQTSVYSVEFCSEDCSVWWRVVGLSAVRRWVVL